MEPQPNVRKVIIPAIPPVPRGQTRTGTPTTRPAPPATVWITPQITPRVPLPTTLKVLLPTTPRVPLPTTPKVPLPTTPKVPLPTTPKVPLPTAIPQPRMPAIPQPRMPAIPQPRIPAIPQPRVPTVPRVPASPPKPTPRLPQPRIPTVPRPASPPKPTRQVAKTASPPRVPNLDSPVETFVDIVIAEQDADIMDEKEYLGYVHYLLNDDSKYNIFARLFPQNTCVNLTLHLENANAPLLIYPKRESFTNCIRSKEKLGVSVAVNFTYDNHANMLWVDTVNKIINRYDPEVHATVGKQVIIDDNLRAAFSRLLPDYAYIGNTLEEWQCVQGVRGVGRTYKGDYYCQDYSLLYAINRFNGMNHEEAAFNLVAKGDDILVDLAELLRALAYKIRAEMGKEIPERFRNWAPVL